MKRPTNDAQSLKLLNNNKINKITKIQQQKDFIKT